MSREPRYLLKAEEIDAMEEGEGHHPLNPESEVHYRMLGDAVGLRGIGFHLVRLPPGKEANEHHTHTYEDEFYYVLSGTGTVIIDGEEHEIGPGDFMGFPAPSPVHMIANPFEDELVYLVGGQREEFEIARMARHGKILIRDRGRAYLVDEDALELMWSREEGIVDEPDDD